MLPLLEPLLPERPNCSSARRMQSACALLEVIVRQLCRASSSVRAPVVVPIELPPAAAPPVAEPAPMLLPEPDDMPEDPEVPAPEVVPVLPEPLLLPMEPLDPEPLVAPPRVELPLPGEPAPLDIDESPDDVPPVDCAMAAGIAAPSTSALAVHRMWSLNLMSTSWYFEALAAASHIPIVPGPTGAQRILSP